MSQQLEMFEENIQTVGQFLRSEIDLDQLVQAADTISYHADGTVTLNFGQPPEGDNVFCECENNMFCTCEARFNEF